MPVTIYEKTIEYAFEVESDHCETLHLTMGAETDAEFGNLIVLKQAGNRVEFPVDFAAAIAKFAFGDSEFDAG